MVAITDQECIQSGDTSTRHWWHGSLGNIKPIGNERCGHQNSSKGYRNANLVYSYTGATECKERLPNGSGVN